MVDRDPTAEPDVSIEDVRFSLVRLLSWPDLSQLPESKQVLVARICSLLSRKPTAGHLIPRVFGEPEQSVFMAVRDLARGAHVGVISAALANSDLPVATASAPLTQPIPLTPEWQPELPRRSLVGKLWSKLID